MFLPSVLIKSHKYKSLKALLKRLLLGLGFQGTFFFQSYTDAPFGTNLFYVHTIRNIILLNYVLFARTNKVLYRLHNSMA